MNKQPAMRNPTTKKHLKLQWRKQWKKLIENDEEGSFGQVTPKFDEPNTGDKESNNEDRFESLNGTPMQRTIKRKPADSNEERSSRQVTPKFN